MTRRPRGARAGETARTVLASSKPQNRNPINTQITDTDTKPALNKGEDISVYIHGATTLNDVGVQKLHATIKKGFEIVPPGVPFRGRIGDFLDASDDGLDVPPTRSASPAQWRHFSASRTCTPSRPMRLQKRSQSIKWNLKRRDSWHQERRWCWTERLDRYQPRRRVITTGPDGKAINHGPKDSYIPEGG